MWSQLKQSGLQTLPLLPSPAINVLQSQEVPSMASVRDGISDAMWESRGASRT
jgi:hypothetical protein